MKLIVLIVGSFATASCLICKYKVDCEAVRGDIFNQVIVISIHVLGIVNISALLLFLLTNLFLPKVCGIGRC